MSNMMPPVAISICSRTEKTGDGSGQARCQAPTASRWRRRCRQTYRHQMAGVPRQGASAALAFCGIADAAGEQVVVGPGLGGGEFRNCSSGEPHDLLVGDQKGLADADRVVDDPSDGGVPVAAPACR